MDILYFLGGFFLCWLMSRSKKCPCQFRKEFYRGFNIEYEQAGDGSWVATAKGEDGMFSFNEPIESLMELSCAVRFAINDFYGDEEGGDDGEEDRECVSMN